MANYHHGNLDTELLANARVLLEESPSAISIREIARRTGVSHAAAAHHFTGKRGLLTALAADGFRSLARGLASAGDDFLEAAVQYVRFATSNPGLYSLMFDPKAVDGAAPDLAEARSEAGRLLHTGVGTVLDESARLDPEAAALASLPAGRRFPGRDDTQAWSDPVLGGHDVVATVRLRFPGRPFIGSVLRRL